jgi:hypothetical protein
MKIMGKVLTGIVMLLPGLVMAQSFTETALLFSRVKPAGSARIMGMGGVQTSLGGDYSSALSNPAGLGMFNRSEFTISPGFYGANVNSMYLGNKTSESKTNLHIPGFSLVFQTEQDGRKGFLSGTFAVSYNRINNFNQTFSYNGDNGNNSIIDYFIQASNGTNPIHFEYPDADYLNLYPIDSNKFNTRQALAFNTYLTDNVGTTTNPIYGSPLQTFDDPADIRWVMQNEIVRESGTQSQWNLSYGANLNDKLFLGAGLGLSTIRYRRETIFSESDFFFELDPDFNPLDRLDLIEELQIRASGINATLGAIYRPLDIVQIGLSYTTPTLLSVTDVYRAELTTEWNNFDYYGDGQTILNSENEYTDEIISEYSLRTPGKLSAGATVFLGKSGFISADVDLINYSGARYSSGISGISFDSDNENIKDAYQTTTNVRLGGEFRLDKLRFRAGGSYMPDPNKTEQNNSSRDITSITGGVGYRTQKFYVDFALILSQGANTYRPYRVNMTSSPLVTMDNKTTFGMVTLGFPF